MSQVLERELDSPEATARCAAVLGQLAIEGTAIGLIGDLGAGKTQFVQGLAKGLDAGDRVTSPTFTLINEYRGGRIPLIHADLYRIEADPELDQLGLFEALDDPVVVVIEWAERFKVLPTDHLRIELEHTGDTSRRLRATAAGPASAKLLLRWRDALG
ncbi:MAG: tRNA (adenosine(37)-N6)-threonylcarbamoyltransferase complex ATPase subunit type 1 TsaE [Deltaproteobacteria bacterium]|nr:tRNA (adenosine(37)-N6)-threonylcarbamoyltransferase complex ATPase subunit type 1 TsaE [Deltaproteobacteria bacterium]